MKFLCKYSLVISIGLLLTACSLFSPKENTRTVALADNLQPQLISDTSTIAFEESFFEELEQQTEESREIDLDELYATFENIPDYALPVFSDEQVEAQVNALSGNVNIRYNDEIKPFINKFTSKKGRKFMSKVLALSKLYFPIFERILPEEGVPQELKYAAVVESALIPNIRSRAGAVGLWQFMRRTGREYGLEVGYNVDARCDIYKSTRASARYMRNLYNTYGDWLLVLAAYNCGPGNVNKAMARSGGSDFWSIYDYLPRETRRHIPKFIAIYYAFFYHTDLMIAPMRDMVKYTDVRKVSVSKPIHLGQVAKVLNLEEKDLAELNRNYLRGYIPAKNKSYNLVLPAYEATLFEVYQDSIYGYNRSEYFSDAGKLIAKRKDFYPAHSVSQGGGRRTYHKVRRGDALGKIARRYGTTVRNLKKWNGLRSDKIRIGQRLVVYASRNYAGKTSKGSRRYKGAGKYIYHTVRRNETCWSIAKKYSGVSQKELMQLNNLKNPRALRVGQKLKIKRKG